MGDGDAVRVDSVGVWIAPDAVGDAAVDVLLDGRRIWSFRPSRSAVEGRVRWPVALRRHLDGVARLEVVEAGTGRRLAQDDVRFGTATTPATLADAAGHPLTVDKGGHLQRTFAETGEDLRAAIVDATRRVLADLHEQCGLDAYLAYGCLLGAVRDGRMIGHDADADVAYLSRHTHPFDVIRENRRVREQMAGLGWEVVGLSSAAFKIWFPLPDGRRCGIDVFGSFTIGDRFHLMGSLRGELPRSAVLPLGSVELEGVPLPAPADPERFLAFCYGPGWRVPDPAFSFDHDPADVRRMDSWFRSHRRGLKYWVDFHRGPRGRRLPRDPSPFARWAADRLPSGATVVEVGCGQGADAVWFAGQGHPVLALDVSGDALRATSRLASERGVEVRTGLLNLEHLQRVLVRGARLAHQPESRAVYARGVLDVLSPSGRANLWRFASMTLRGGGPLLLEFRTPTSADDSGVYGRRAREHVDPAMVAAEVEAAGGTVVERFVSRGLARTAEQDPEICRLVVRWR
jgi:hypothetical protein